MKDLELTFDRVVIGGSYAAYEYAYQNQFPVITTVPLKPHRFHKDSDKMEAWDLLVFTLSLCGLMPFSNNVKLLRYDEDADALKLLTMNERLVKIRFNKLFVFNDDEFKGLPIPLRNSLEYYEVIDWFNIKSGMNITEDCLIPGGESKFVSKLFFYPSERLDAMVDNIRDVAALSYLKPEQLEDVEYSESYSRLKTLRLMKDAGFRGGKSGQVYYALKIEIDRREVYPIGGNIYPNSNKMEFMDALRDV